ncbi:hypothetical protein Tco_1375897 [Tanacetum coccineum]
MGGGRQKGNRNNKVDNWTAVWREGQGKGCAESGCCGTGATKIEGGNTKSGTTLRVEHRGGHNVEVQGGWGCCNGGGGVGRAGAPRPSSPQARDHGGKTTAIRMDKQGAEGRRTKKHEALVGRKGEGGTANPRPQTGEPGGINEAGSKMRENGGMRQGGCLGAVDDRGWGIAGVMSVPEELCTRGVGPLGLTLVAWLICWLAKKLCWLAPRRAIWRQVTTDKGHLDCCGAESED